MPLHLSALAAAAILLAACSRAEPPTENEADSGAPSAPPGNAAQTPLEPPAPGEPGGLADDRTSVAEGPIDANSAQGAAQVVQSYFALLESGRHAEAWRLWGGDGAASGSSASGFAERYRQYREYHAQIGAPGPIEGAAGSIYVDVPVQVYGRLANGEQFSRAGTVTLRRVNDVPGSTAGQRRWHIERSTVEPPG